MGFRFSLALLLKKCIFGFTLVIFNNYPYICLIILILTSGILLILQLKRNPFQQKFHIIFTLIPEITYLIIYCVSFGLLKENVTPYARKISALIIIVCLWVDFCILILQTFVSYLEIIIEFF